MQDSFSNTGSAFAIVSPCSQCKNQSSSMGLDGKPYCPRRKWQEDIKKAKDPANTPTDTVAPGVEILGAFGTEGTDKEGDNSLRNPVYLDNGKTALVWIATLRDNSGVRDGDGNITVPNILDSSFIPDHTDWIHCRPLPYIPLQHEAAYRQSGGLKEGDQLMVLTATDQQQETSSTPETGSDSMEYRQVKVEGVAIKTNFTFKVPRAPVEVDHTVSGT